MKRGMLWMVMAAALLLYGCAPEREISPVATEMPADGAEEQQAANPEQSTVNDEFKEVARVINALYGDKLIIGDERYMDIKSQLDRYESLGIGKDEIPGLRVKLEALRPDSGKSSAPDHPEADRTDDFSNLEKEISTIFESQNLISPEHYSRIKADIDYFESQGKDKALIDSLRKKVELFNVPHPAPLNVSSNDTFRKDPELPSPLERTQLPDCNGKMFTFFPVDMQKVYEISPLGSIGPPGHTFPTEHSFIHLHASGTSTELYPLYAPADVYITHVREVFGITKDPVDYTIYFALCKDLIGYYNHPKELSPEIKEILKDVDCVDFGLEGTCARNALAKVNAGTMLGKVGGKQGNFDFGLIDLSKTNSFANPGRYGTRSLHVQCPYDYYSEPQKQKFLSLIKRDDAGQCGLIAQDIPGTLKGNWFYGDARADLGTDWNRHLAFLQENGDQGKLTVSIGGTVSDPKKITFTPENAGTANRDFSQVIPDGKIYCFTDGSSKAIVQLTSPNMLKIERMQGNCTTSESFSNPFTYER